MESLIQAVLHRGQLSMRCIGALPVVRHLLLGSRRGSLRRLNIPASTNMLVAFRQSLVSQQAFSKAPIHWIFAGHVKPNYRYLLTAWLSPKHVQTDEDVQTDEELSSSCHK